MSADSPAEHNDDPRIAAWAPPVSRLTVTDTHVPAGGLNLNVEGRQLTGPLQGFGQLWQKTYAVRLPGVALEPAALMDLWKKNFPKFWPPGNRFYPPLIGIAPGEVAVLNLAMPGGMPLSTGVMVLYADDVSFTLMTPEGHMESGWITFSAYQDAAGVTVAQVQSIARANDPMYEIGFLLFAHRRQEAFWQYTLAALARHFGLAAQVETRKVCVDPRWQWSQVKNVWHNAAVRTGAYVALTPVRWARRLLGR